MRILHIVTMLERGGAQFNTMLSTGDAIRRGHAAWMIASPGDLSDEAKRRLGPASIELGGLIDPAAIPGLLPGRKRYPFRTSAMVREVAPVRDTQAMMSLYRLIRLLRPDIVHTHSSKAGILGRWAAYAAGARHIIHTAHGWGFHDRQSAASRAVYESAERITARITERIVVVAHDNREKALRRGIGRPGQYVTIRSGIEIDAERLRQGREAKRRELGVAPGDPLAIWVGNFKPQKAPLDMARAAAALVAGHPSLHVIVIGDGDLRPQVEALLPDRARIHLLGWRPDAAELIAAADVLFHTAIFEGLPRVLLEAAALGVPAVSTDVDGIPEIVKEGETGRLFRSGEWEKIAAATLELVRDEALRGRMGEAARRNFRGEFTLASMFDALAELYDGVMRTGS